MACRSEDAAFMILGCAGVVAIGMALAASGGFLADGDRPVAKLSPKPVAAALRAGAAAIGAIPPENR